MEREREREWVPLIWEAQILWEAFSGAHMDNYFLDSAIGFYLFAMHVKYLTVEHILVLNQLMSISF